MTIIEALERLQVETMEFWLGVALGSCFLLFGALRVLDEKTKAPEDKERF